MSKLKHYPEQTELETLYIVKNHSVNEMSVLLHISTATINRLLKKYNIKKTEEARRANISKTKRAKTEEEKIEYSKHISEARKGKGLGKIPWNKGKHPGNNWLGKHHTEETKKKISITKNNKSIEEKKLIEAKRMASRKYTTPWNKGKHTGAWTAEQKAIILAKQYKTKKQNASFNSSKAEENYYRKLCLKYGQENVIRQYSSDSRYPFNCDFYIKSKDLFIELNLSWTHGGHPFSQQNKADLIKLNSWKEKAKASEYYKNAIETWTVRDVKKHQAVKINKLNYIEYYSETELLGDLNE